jgi:hypothetical protein
VLERAGVRATVVGKLRKRARASRTGASLVEERRRREERERRRERRTEEETE